MRDPRVASNHLSRDAYLYIRQSTLRQVSENGESTRRQYALRERALSLGWPAGRIHVIDQDPECPGRTAQDVTASKNWSPRWGFARSASCSGWRSHVWLATR